jgi:hypothetical protein
VIVTVKDWLMLFECASVAVHVTVLAPTANVLPEGGLQDGVIVPSTRSLAFGIAG